MSKKKTAAHRTPERIRQPAADSTLCRCRVVASVRNEKHEYSKALGPGLIVDMAEIVAPGVTLRDLLADKRGDLPAGWFEPMRANADRAENEET